MCWGSAKTFLRLVSGWQVSCLSMAREPVWLSIALVWARAPHHLPQRCGLALEQPGGRAMWVFFWNSFVPVGGDKKGQKPNGNVPYLNKKRKMVRRWGDYSTFVINCHTEKIQREGLSSFRVQRSRIICKCFISLVKSASNLSRNGKFCFHKSPAF